MENRIVARGTNIAETYSQKLEGMEVDDLKAAISMTETQIKDLEGQLAHIQAKISNAQHDLSLHASYHGTGSREVRADSAIIDDLVLERSRLSHDLGELRSNLMHLKGRIVYVGRQELKSAAAEGEIEIRKTAKKLLDSVEAAIDANERYKDIRKSFKAPRPSWPFWNNHLSTHETALWVEKIRRFLKEK